MYQAIDVVYSVDAVRASDMSGNGKKICKTIITIEARIFPRLMFLIRIL